MKIDKLISLLDNNKEIINQENDGLLIWPVIRYLVIQHLINKINSINSPYSKSSNSKLQILKKILYGFIKNPFFGPTKPTLIFSSQTSYIKTYDNKYYNRITDYFLELDSINCWKIDEDIEPNQKKKYKSYSKNIITIYIEIITKCKLVIFSEKEKKIRNQTKNIIDNINDKLIKYNIKIEDKAFIEALLKSVNRMSNTYYIYNKLFKIKKIKKIIIEDGYYGVDKAIIIKAAKDNNIIVQEPQHGFINENHPCYNYGIEVINNNNIKKYYPDCFLSYGEFWTNSINVPNKVVNIGNPHLEKSIENTTDLKTEKKILIVGSGVTIDETNKLLLKLIESVSNEYKLYYRPHPQESKDFLNRYNEAFLRGVLIDNDELYKSLATSEIIIGELTTVIFEAVAMNKKIYLYNSSYTKAYFSENIKYFNVFEIQDISKILKNKKTENKQEYYWKMGWKNSYLNLN